MLKAFTSILVLLVASAVASAQPAPVSFDSTSKVFRLDGGGSSYVFGVNARGELQQLYWGGRLGAADRFAQAAPMREWASFDSSYNNTPQEYAGWGAGVFVRARGDRGGGGNGERVDACFEWDGRVCGEGVAEGRCFADWWASWGGAALRAKRSG